MFSTNDIQMSNRYTKMCLTSYQGNVNRNHHELSPQTCQNGHHQKTSNAKCRRGCGETGPSCPVGGIVNWCRHYGKQYARSSNIQTTASMWPSNSSSGHWSKRNKIITVKERMHADVHSIVHDRQGIETAEVSISGWIKQMWHTHDGIRDNVSLSTYNDIYDLLGMYVNYIRT